MDEKTPSPVDGVIVVWHEADGWGVLRADALPGDVWAYFGDVTAPHRDGIKAGERVRFTWEEVEQDGYPLRAVEVHRLGAPPGEPGSGWAGAPEGEGGAYKSRLVITWDDEPGH